MEYSFFSCLTAEWLHETIIISFDLGKKDSPKKVPFPNISVFLGGWYLKFPNFSGIRTSGVKRAAMLYRTQRIKLKPGLILWSFAGITVSSVSNTLIVHISASRSDYPADKPSKMKRRSRQRQNPTTGRRQQQTRKDGRLQPAKHNGQSGRRSEETCCSKD